MILGILTQRSYASKYQTGEFLCNLVLINITPHKDLFHPLKRRSNNCITLNLPVRACIVHCKFPTDERKKNPQSVLITIILPFPYRNLSNAVVQRDDTILENRPHAARYLCGIPASER